MNANHAYLVAIVAYLGIGLFSPRAADAQDFTPKTEAWTIPITAQGNRTVECVIPFGPVSTISAVAFSPDGKTLAVGGYQEVLLWDLAGAKLAKRLGAGKLAGPVRAMAFLKDGRLAVGDGRPNTPGAVRLFNVESGEPVHAFEEPSDVVHAIAVSADGKLLAAGGAYLPIHVWNVDEKKLVATLEGHRGWVQDLQFKKDGKFLLSAGADNRSQVWDTTTWKSTAKFLHDGTINGGAIGPDGNTLVLAVGGPKEWGLRLRKASDSRYVRSLYMSGGAPLSVLWLAKGNRLVVPCDDHSVQIIDASNSRRLATLTGHRDWVYCVAVSPDGTRLASGSGDGTVKLWNLAENKLLATLVQLTPKTDRWLLVTAAGYMATSSADALEWKMSNMETPVDALAAMLLNPELTQKAIAGEATDPPPLK